MKLTQIFCDFFCETGGWFPIALSAVVFAISAIWFYGRQRKSVYVKANSQYLEQVLALGPPSQ